MFLVNIAFGAPCSADECSICIDETQLEKFDCYGVRNLRTLSLGLWSRRFFRTAISRPKVKVEKRIPHLTVILLEKRLLSGYDFEHCYRSCDRMTSHMLGSKTDWALLFIFFAAGIA